MKCFFCTREYRLNELVLIEPAICPLCVLGVGNHFYVYKELRRNYYRRIAQNIVKSPRLIHILKCMIP